jgi:hypothetical protein
LSVAGLSNHHVFREESQRHHKSDFFQLYHVPVL